MRTIKVIGFAFYGSLAASNRVRLGQYREGLLDYGIHLQVQSVLPNEYVRYRFNGGFFPIIPVMKAAIERLYLLLKSQSFDIAIVHCELLPFFPASIENFLLGIPYIYDFDDAFYLRYKNGKLSNFKCFLGSKFDKVIEHAALVTAGSKQLVDYACKFNSNTFLLPSVVNTDLFYPKKREESTIFTVGWIGTPSTVIYLQQILKPLEIVGSNIPLRFIVIGAKAPNIDNVEVLEIAWSQEQEVDMINMFDVGVMPLINDEWARGKCAYKLIQYMSCGVPVIASKVGTNSDLVTPECGFLVSTEQEWIDALIYMINHPIERKMMGICGRDRIISQYSLNHNLPILANMIKKLALG